VLVLDTDHLSVLEHKSPAADRLRNRLNNATGEQVFATIISFEEQMRGWMAYLAQCRSVKTQIEAYSRLLSHVNNYRTIELLGFDEQAAIEYQRLRKSISRLGAMDLKIAAIVVRNDATLLSRNLSDFKRISSLRVVDWTA
jgi:tRNA(fMet)-specific endonuclease VapC